MAAFEPAHRISRLWILFAGFALLLVTFFAGVYLLVIRPPAGAIGRGFDSARQIAQELSAALPLKSTVRERTILVFHPPKDRADWLAVEESFLVRHEFEDSFLGSVKRFEVEAVARVGMGFSFSGEWAMKLDPGAGRAVIGLPEPGVLFVEVSDVKIRRDEDGLWNRLTAEDREAALRKLEEDARTQFDEAALAQRARASMLQLLNRVLQDHGFEVVWEQEENLSPLP